MPTNFSSIPLWAMGVDGRIISDGPGRASGDEPDTAVAHTSPKTFRSGLSCLSTVVRARPR